MDVFARSEPEDDVILAEELDADADDDQQGPVPTEEEIQATLMQLDRPSFPSLSRKDT
ncbi:hypothetical protein HDU76_006048, partial [Blyttiomyces sp. JEL0837]